MHLQFIACSHLDLARQIDIPMITGLPLLIKHTGSNQKLDSGNKADTWCVRNSSVQWSKFFSTLNSVPERSVVWLLQAVHWFSSPYLSSSPSPAPPLAPPPSLLTSRASHGAGHKGVYPGRCACIEANRQVDNTRESTLADVLA